MYWSRISIEAWVCKYDYNLHLCCVHFVCAIQSLPGVQNSVVLWILILLPTVCPGNFPRRCHVLPLRLLLFPLLCCILLTPEGNVNKDRIIIQHKANKTDFHTERFLWCHLYMRLNVTFLSHCWWRYRNKMFVFSVTMTADETTMTLIRSGGNTHHLEVALSLRDLTYRLVGDYTERPGSKQWSPLMRWPLA